MSVRSFVQIMQDAAQRNGLPDPFPEGADKATQVIHQHEGGLLPDNVIPAAINQTRDCRLFGSTQAKLAVEYMEHAGWVFDGDAWVSRHGRYLSDRL